jgi:hypothetical protein
VEAAPSADRTNPDYQEVWPPPQQNPRAFDITVPTSEPHWVVFYESADGVTKGDIITSYLQQSQDPDIIFDTIDDLKHFSAPPLQYATVLGYYTKGDGGGGNFMWDAASTLPDNGGTIIQPTGVTTGRWIRIMEECCISIKIFGAKGDGLTEDTPFIQAALDAVAAMGGGAIKFPKGQYLVTPTDSLFNMITIGANTAISLDTGAVIQVGATNRELYRIFYINGVTNVKINGGVMIGDRENHTGTTGESGLLVAITNSKDVSVSDMILYNSWGDGLYVGGGSGQESERITLSNLNIHNNRRNGISIVACKVANLDNINSYLQNGTNPESGIDLEPNPDCVVEDINISNINTYNNNGPGFVSSATRVTLSNLHAYNNGTRGVWIASEGGHLLNNLFCYNNTEAGIYLGFSSKVYINNAACNNNSLQGISIINCIEDIYVIACMLYSNTMQGLLISGATMTKWGISNSVISNNTTNGIDMSVDYGKVDNNMIFGNSRGISATGKYVEISGNKIYANQREGIFTLCTQSKISDNHVFANSQMTDNGYANIVLSTGATGNLLNGNRVKVGELASKPKYGIQIVDAASTNSVYDNDIIGSGLTADIIDASPTTIRYVSIPGISVVLTAGNSAPDQNVTVRSVITTEFLDTRGTSGNWVLFKTPSGVNRWLLSKVDGESTGNLGANLQLNSRADDGSALAQVMKFYRSTGNIRMGTTGADPGNKLAVEGSVSVTEQYKMPNGVSIIQSASTVPFEGNITAAVGSLGLLSGDNTHPIVRLFIKATGTGNTGWQPVYEATVIVSAPVASTDITIAYMDANYPSLGIGKVVYFSNLSDDPANAMLVTKLAASSYCSSLQVKLT